VNGTDERRARYRLGHYAEWAAAAVLLARGYWILARREKTPLGEIDIIAVRGRRIAFIEVKRRDSLEAAEASITPAQRTRTRRAAGLWLARNARYQTHEQGYDVIFVIGRSWPRHLENAL
jgi:putative endonuclease